MSRKRWSLQRSVSRLSIRIGKTIQTMSRETMQAGEMVAVMHGDRGGRGRIWPIEPERDIPARWRFVSQDDSSLLTPNRLLTACEDVDEKRVLHGYTVLFKLCHPHDENLRTRVRVRGGERESQCNKET